MSKILISGYYGFQNLGDEAILAAIVGRIKKLDSKIEITVLSQNPGVTSSRLGVRSVFRNSPVTLLKELASTELLISGGGSLLQDDTSSKSIIYYLLIIFVAKILRKKVMIYSQGIGPIHIEKNRKLTRFVLQYVNIITVREPFSKNDLIGLGILEDRIIVTTDPVIGLERGNAKDGIAFLYARISGETDIKFIEETVTPVIGVDERIPLIQSKMRMKTDRKIIGVSVRTKDFIDPRVWDEFILFIKHSVLDYHIVLLPFYQEMDVEIAKKIKEEVPEVILFDSNLKILEMMDVISAIDIMVATRLHALIFSTVCETPMIAISYDPKIDYFMKSVGLQALCSVNNITTKLLQEECEKVISDSIEIKKSLIEFISSEKNKLLMNDELLLQLLNC